jgi:UDP-glucose 4-epimerase
MKNILVVGGAGYIGSHTVKHLVENNYNVIVADNLSMGHREAVYTPHFEIADLMDKNSLDQVFKKYQIDTVIHFAAFIAVGESVENPAKYYRNNVVGTLNLLDVMIENNVKKIVFSSTAAVFGNPKYTPIDEKHITNPINPYGQTKLMIEKIFADYEKAYGLKYIAFRYFNASGCSSDGSIGESHNPETHLIPLVLKAINGERENIKIFGDDYETPDGTCIRDYIHVEDLAVAHRLAVEKIDEFSGCLNLGTSKGTSVKEIIAIAEKITGKKCPVVIEKRRAGDPAILSAISDKAKEILGWEPIKDMENIIKTAWNWELNKKY